MTPAALWAKFDAAEAFCESTWSNLRALELVHELYRDAAELNITSPYTLDAYRQAARMAKIARSNEIIVRHLRLLRAALAASSATRLS